MEQLKITAVLPCHNHARFLEERINSILSQTLPVSEIIFIDDASSDDSLKKAKELLTRAKAKVRFIENKITSGSPFAQWNKGVQLSSHPLIWIAETDDYCKPELLERLYSFIMQPGHVLSFAQSYYSNENSQPTGSALTYTNELWPNLFSKDLNMKGSDFNTLCLTAINAIPNASAVLFSKEAYMQAGQANPCMRYAGDWDMWIRICRLGKISFTSEHLNYFRYHHLTTRALGSKAAIEAEALACRIQAQLLAHHQHKNAKKTTPHTASPFASIKIIHQTIKASQHLPFATLPLNSFGPAATHYRSLKNAPSLSLFAWIYILVLHLHNRITLKLITMTKTNNI